MKFLLVFLSLLPLSAQQTIDNSNAEKTIPWKLRDMEPGHCVPGESYLNTTSGKLRRCIAPNTWGDVVTTDALGNVVVGGTVLNSATLARLTQPHAAMVTIAIGNSITYRNQLGADGAAGQWRTYAELHLANALAGSPMIFSRMAASTRADGYGIYGYSGQTLPTILADLPAQLFTPLQTAGIVPDLVIGHALAENDISFALAGTAAATIAGIKSNIVQFIRDVHARYPKAIILLCTPRPSSSNNISDRVQAYQAIRDYVLSLDDGAIAGGARVNGNLSIPPDVSILVARLDPYEDPANPGTPLPYLTNGFTDPTVHPTPKGALRNARIIAATLKRISTSWLQPYYSISTNMAMTGTAAVSGVHISGTAPTGVTIADSAGGTFVVTAEQPGWLKSSTANSSGSEPPTDLGVDNMAQVTFTGGANTQISPFFEVEIVSGAANLSFPMIEPRLYYNGTNSFVLYVARQTGDGALNAGGVPTEPEWANGDVLLFRQPAQVAPSGTFTNVTNYFKAWPVLGGGAFTVRIRSSGVQIVVP